MGGPQPEGGPSLDESAPAGDDFVAHLCVDWEAGPEAFARRMVNDEVQKALVSASDLLNRNLYLTALQMGLRVAFGLGLWLTWAVFVDPLP